MFWRPLDSFLCRALEWAVVKSADQVLCKRTSECFYVLVTCFAPLTILSHSLASCYGTDEKPTLRILIFTQLLIYSLYEKFVSSDF